MGLAASTAYKKTHQLSRVDGAVGTVLERSTIGGLEP